MPYCETCGKKIRRGARFCLAHHTEGVRDYKRRRREDDMKLIAGLGAGKERIKRYCLKCDRPFVAHGRFNRICENCTKNNQDIIDYEARYTIAR